MTPRGVKTWHGGVDERRDREGGRAGEGKEMDWGGIGRLLGRSKRDWGRTGKLVGRKNMDWAAGGGGIGGPSSCDCWEAGG